MIRGVLALAALVVVLPGVASSQIAGPLMPPGDLEVGIAWQRIDRELSYAGAPDWEFVQDSGILVLSYGLTERATLRVALSSDADPLQGEGVYWTVGGGIATSIWNQGCFHATASIFYSETLGRSRNDGSYAWWESVVAWNALAEMRLGAREAFTLWAGPSVSSIVAQAHVPPNSQNWVSDAEVGLVFGGRAVLWRHLVLQAGSDWVGGGLQSHAMLGYHF